MQILMSKFLCHRQVGSGVNVPSSEVYYPDKSPLWFPCFSLECRLGRFVSFVLFLGTGYRRFYLFNKESGLSSVRKRIQSSVGKVGRSILTRKRYKFPTTLLCFLYIVSQHTSVRRTPRAVEVNRPGNLFLERLRTWSRRTTPGNRILFCLLDSSPIDLLTIFIIFEVLVRRGFF